MKNCSLILLFLSSLFFFSCNKKGCTDLKANNYSASAKSDNSICDYSVLDKDGNSIDAKRIGNQIWITQNLKVKKYKNGDLIPQIQNDADWAALTTGAWCYYNNDPSQGVLYNWYAVNDHRGLAPTGWHIPTKEEWITLYNYLGGPSWAANKIKNTSGWIQSNGTNESGFSAIPVGHRDPWGTFECLTSSGGKAKDAYWHTSTEFNLANSNYTSILYNMNIPLFGDLDKKKGISVRCVKD
jgi:uncharacterized protein (TIGR02145 family)